MQKNNKMISKLVKNLLKLIYLRLPLLIVVFLLFLFGCALQQVTRDSYYSVKHRVKGNYYLDNKKYKEGIEDFEQELKKNPESSEAQYFMGRFQLAENHTKEGLYHLQQAVKLSPEKADYHFWLGVAYSVNKESDLERKSYLRALELNHNHVQALTYLGHNQLEKSEYENALKTYNKVLELSPDNPSALYNRALILKHFERTPEEKLGWKEYLALYRSGVMGQQAALNLNSLGEFEYRNHLIGRRMVTLEKVRFEPFTAKIWEGSQTSLDLLGEILKNNDNVAIHIVVYQKNNKELAELRAKSVKKYLINKFPEIKSSRFIVSWFGVPEEIKIGTKIFWEDESINFFSAVQPQKK